MLTTGFKLFFGFFAAALLAAFVFGYTTGGHGLGPLTLGIDGGIGDHLGYVALLAVAAVSGGIGLTLVAFRDADAAAAAELAGTEQAPVHRPTQPSYWPLVGAVGATTAVVGLVVHGAVFVLGLVIVAGAAVEWTMQAWADRASGDPALNRRLRNRIMEPIELPAAAALAIAVIPLAMSRIFLAVSELGAVWVATAISVAILALGAVLFLRPRVSRNVTAAVVLVGGLALVAGGITAAVVGEREIEPHGPGHESSPATDLDGPGDTW